MPHNKCQSRRHSDQQICARCGLVWDLGDPEPPRCLTNREIALNLARGFTRGAKRPKPGDGPK